MCRYHVLVYGNSLQGLPFQERDQERERLRFELLKAGTILLEHVWIWDETDTAQLLIRSYESALDACKRKEVLEEVGLKVRVVCESYFDKFL